MLLIYSHNIVQHKQFHILGKSLGYSAYAVFIDSTAQQKVSWVHALFQCFILNNITILYNYIANVWYTFVD